MPKILVSGANGTVGALLVDALAARGEEVQAGSRSGVGRAGVPAVRLDYADPATFAPAFEGVDRLYLLMPADNLAVEDSLLPVVAYAAAHRVKVVMQSVMGVEDGPPNPYRNVELALQASASPWVILRPNWFADNFHGLWAPAVARGVIALPAGDGASSFIDARDIADCAAAALTSARFDHQAFTLTGPQALGYAEAAELLSAVAQRRIVYTPTSDDDFVAGLRRHGLPEAHGRMLAGLFAAVQAGHTAAVTDAVDQLTGRPARTLTQYAADHAAAFR